MNSNIDTPTTPFRRRIGRILSRFASYATLFAILAVILYLIADQIYLARAVEQREGFDDRFQPMIVSEAMRDQVEPRFDAARYYRYAALLLSKADPGFNVPNQNDPLTLILQTTATPAPGDPLRTRIESASPAIDILMHVATKTAAVYKPAIENNDYLTHIDEMRGLASYLNAQAILSAYDGDARAASNYLAAALNLANNCEGNPNLIWCMIAQGSAMNGRSAAQKILGMTHLDETTGIERELKRLGDSDNFKRAIVNETKQMNDFLYEQSPLRLFGALNEIATLRFVMNLDEAMKRDTYQQRVELLDTYKHAGGRRITLTPLLQMTVPNVLRSAQSDAEFKIYVTQFQTAIALNHYKRQLGRYPDTLDALVPQFMTAVPQDAFSASPMTYTHEANGYTLLSIGPDGKDNGGIEGQDLVWTVTHEP
ncbi:MAG: hypothetical protein AMXMBFR84_32780 [Candidatus Hydrogenedentota bacterium]